jgi:LacI family transcriptional regulator/LacI family repressor for deo operon, udp, cdd, tsx, nupC, and nupG
MPPNHVTLRDIAEKTGMSRSTVSQALRGAGKLAPKTREHIRRVAEEMGYQPDPLLSAFSRRRAPGASPGSVIGLISPKPQIDELLRPLVEPARRLGYRLEVFCPGEYSSQKALVNVLRARGIAGVLFPQVDPRIVLEPGLWEPLRGVYCGTYPVAETQPCPFPMVRQGAFDAMSLAWHKAVAAGYKRIGCILLGGEDLRRSSVEKGLACYRYRQTMQHPPLAGLAPLLEEYRTLRARPEIAHAWIEQQKPDVIIAFMYGIYEHLTDCGYRIPEDFAFINLKHREIDPHIAGILHDRVSINREALFNLHSIIQFGQEMPPLQSKSVTIDPIWHDGPSLPAKR